MTKVLTEEELFDWLRSNQSNKKLTQDMVDGTHELLAFMTTTELKKTLTKVNGWHELMKLSEQGSELIKKYEKYVGHPYKDMVGVWTIGFGNTYYEDRSSVKETDKPISLTRANELKTNIINMDFAPAVNLMFADEIANGRISQNQFDALVSLAYNIGTKGLAGSSVANYIKAGDMNRAAANFMSWNKGRVNGKLVTINGLTNRRDKERLLFLA